jgi:2-oxoglutarate ferredoxin oxidoreductase subunit beta
MPREEVMKWLRARFFPHIWCPGCGHGIVMHALLRSLVALDKKPEETVIASGIGCSSRFPAYINACTCTPPTAAPSGSPRGSSSPSPN